MTIEVFMIHIGAGEFKSKCLKLMDLTEQKHETFIITKRGVPVAKLVPYSDTAPSLFGYMKNSIKTKGDVVSSLQEPWDAE